ncbi:MAG: hypothetical protein KKD11_02620, partial [Candidatus Omnitrophica bacterium]|nr:hypothetical protein [Candidatus Omnitrophota bacterium]
MRKFNKPFNLKILSIVISLSVLLNSLTLTYSYAQSKENLRVSLGSYERLKKALSPGPADAILRQQAFPDGISRRLLSGMGIKRTSKISKNETIDIDLSWTGINDNIVITFKPRKEFQKENPISFEGKYSPYIKPERENGFIEYVLPEDITLSELTYLIEDIDSLSRGNPNRLKLSNLFSQRFKFTAIYLAREIPWDSISNENRTRVERQIELLYLLGDMFEEKPNYELTDFKEIKYKLLELPDGESWKALKEYLETNLNFTSWILAKEDRLMAWVDKSAGLIVQETSFAKAAQLKHRISIRGIEEMYADLEIEYDEIQKIFRMFKSLFSETQQKLLKDTLPISEWQKRLEDATPTQEVEIAQEVAREIERYYERRKDEEGFEWPPKYVQMSKRLNCVARTYLIGRIFKDMGINEDRFYRATFPEHAFFIFELSDEAYCLIETTEDGYKHTRILKDISRGYISNHLKAQESILIELSQPLIPRYPQSQTVGVSRFTEGIMASMHLNLTKALIDIDRNGMSKEDMLNILDAVIFECKEALKLDRNLIDALNNLGIALNDKFQLMQSDESDRAIEFLDDAITIYRKALKLNKNQSLVYNNLANSLDNKSLSLQTTKPIESLNLLKDSINYYQKALTLGGFFPHQQAVIERNLK